MSHNRLDGKTWASLNRVTRAAALLAVVGSSMTLAQPAFSTIDNELLAYYCFDGDYETQDCSGNGNHGTAYGGVTQTEGRIGDAYDFDPADGYIDLGTPDDLMFRDAFTVAAWISPDAGAMTNHPAIVSRNGDIGTWVWALQLYDGTPRGLVSGNGSTASDVYSSSGAVAEGEWVHVAMTFDPTDAVRIYVNGHDKGSNDSVPSLLSDEPGVAARIGGDNKGYLYFDGVIDEVRIYQGALTGPEVLELVPEPSTAVLFSLGLAGLALRRRLSA